MNLPNCLTFLRILMIPIVAVLFSRGAYTAAALVFLLACLTDILDGYLARHLQKITEMGKLLDPLADKGMQLTVLVSLAWCGRMPYLSVWIVLGKELLMFLGGLYLFRQQVVVSANWYGKAATVLISACVMAVILLYDFIPPILLQIVQWTPPVAAIFAFVLYFVAFLQQIRKES